MAKLIKEIDDIFGHCERHPSEENLPRLVEEPLVDACITFVRKNIRTICSSANKNDIGASAIIVISAPDLSEENQKIAQEIADYEAPSGHWGHSFGFMYPLTEESTVEEVREHFNKIADAFRTQPYTWANKVTFADYLAISYGAVLSKEEKDFINSQESVEHLESGKVLCWTDIVAEKVASGAYYDEKSGYLYISEKEYYKEKSSTGEILDSTDEPLTKSS